jgi:hypothetical protein
MYASDSLQKINAGRALPLRAGDYDFSREFAFREGRREQRLAKQSEMLAQIPSFQRWYATGKYHEARHSLENVIVLSDPLTYSSGFNLMQSLLDHGAVLLGTPSAQSANNFGDSLITRLGHSGVTVFVSYKLIVNLPADPAPGQIILPDYPLTWDFWAKSDFDPNAEVLMALHIAGQAVRPHAIFSRPTD